MPSPSQSNDPSFEGNLHHSASQAGALAESPYFAAQFEALRDAVQGDPAAIEGLFHYLSTSNRDLRHIILGTLHENPSAAAWQALLPCLAVLLAPDSWVDTGESALATELRRKIMAERRHPYSTGLNFEQIERSLVEAFVLDEDEAEQRLKAAVLYDGLGWMQQRFACGYLLGLRSDLRAIPILEDMAAAGSLKAAAWAVQALAALNDELCGPGLVIALGRDRAALHHDAQRALIELGRKAEPALVSALADRDSHIRWHAARTLGQIGDPRAVDALAAGLDDESQAVRWTSARVLANLDAAAIPAILSVLCCRQLREPLREAAYHALHSMSSHNTQEYLQPLLLALSSPTASVTAPGVANRMLAEWGRRTDDGQPQRGDEMLNH